MSREPLKPEDITLLVAPEIIEQNEFNQVRCEINDIKGNKGLSIRKFYRATKDKTGPDKLTIGPWLPGKQGIRIRFSSLIVRK